MDNKGLTLTPNQRFFLKVVACGIVVIIAVIIYLVNTSNKSDKTSSTTRVHPILYSYECKAIDDPINTFLSNEPWITCRAEDCTTRCDLMDLDMCENHLCTLSNGKCVPKCGTVTATKLSKPMTLEEYKNLTGNKNAGSGDNCCNGYTPKNQEEWTKGQEICNNKEDNYGGYGNFMDCIIDKNIWTGINDCVTLSCV